MSRMEVLVEEPSMEEVLRYLLPKIIGNRAGWKVINRCKRLMVLSSNLTQPD
jgi:hypothetical protein